MTIDEAIERYKAITNTNSICPMPCMSYCEKCVEEHTQLVEWLEELKKYKEKPEGYLWDEAVQQGYNKAIDDFTDKIISLCDDVEFMNRFNELTATTIIEIAEQLKERD